MIFDDADGFDSVNVAFNSVDGFLVGTVGEDTFALARAFGGALDEGAFLSAHD